MDETYYLQNELDDARREIGYVRKTMGRGTL